MRGRLEQSLMCDVMSLLLLPRKSCPALGCPSVMLWSTWLVKMSSTLSAGNLMFRWDRVEARQSCVVRECGKGGNNMTRQLELTVGICILKYAEHFCGPGRF